MACGRLAWRPGHLAREEPRAKGLTENKAVNSIVRRWVAVRGFTELLAFRNGFYCFTSPF